MKQKGLLSVLCNGGIAGLVGCSAPVEMTCKGAIETGCVVKEELGLDVNIGRLLVLDYYPSEGGKTESIMFVFDGGVIEDGDIAKITLQENEISEYRFVDIKEAQGLLYPRLSQRMKMAYEARQNGATLYLEQGKSI